MGDYGIRISIPGQDVKTCNDLDTVVNSKYANLKGSLTASGTTPDIPHDTTVTVTIPHGLSYIPFAKVLVDVFGLNQYKNSPTFNALALEQIDIWHYCDATNLYIKVYQGNVDELTRDGIDYTYYIFLDKGKL